MTRCDEIVVEGTFESVGLLCHKDNTSWRVRGGRGVFVEREWKRAAERRKKNYQKRST